MAHPYIVVAQPGSQAQGDRLCESFSGQVHPGAQSQLPGGSQLLVSVKGAPPGAPALDAAVVDAGQPQPVEQGDPLAYGGHQLFRGRWRDDVADQVDGQLAQHSGRPARRVPIDDSLGWVGCAGGDARLLQRTRVGHCQMHIVAPQQNRVGGGHLVQIAAGGKLTPGPTGLVPALAQYPVTRRGTTCLPGHPPVEIHEGGNLCQQEPAETERPRAEVKMSVGQAREHQTAAQVDRPRAGTGQRPDIRVIADG